jgi:hypothetical protein
MAVVKDLMRRNGRAVQEPVIDAHPVVTPNDVRMMIGVKVFFSP